MIIKPAQINTDGMEVLLRLGSSPDLLDSDLGAVTIGFAGDEQVYIPGISIPNHNTLHKPMYVPVIGDNESLSLVVDIPHIIEAPYRKRVTLIGELIAESVVYELPDSERPLHDEAEAEEKLNDAFDDYTGGWTAFLRATVEVRAVPNASKEGINLLPVKGMDAYEQPGTTLYGHAEFYVVEDESEFDDIAQLLKSAEVSAADIVSHVRLAGLSNLIKRTGENQRISQGI